MPVNGAQVCGPPTSLSAMSYCGRPLSYVLTRPVHVSFPSAFAAAMGMAMATAVRNGERERESGAHHV
jgi:hypothetical protein